MSGFYAKLRLDASRKHYKEIAATFERMLDACNWLSQLAWDAGAFRLATLNYFGYEPCRKHFALPAALANCCATTVAATYRARSVCEEMHVFKPTDALGFAASLPLRYRGMLSLRTLNGRLRVPYTDVLGAGFAKLAPRTLHWAELSLHDEVAMVRVVLQ